MSEPIIYLFAYSFAWLDVGAQANLLLMGERHLSRKFHFITTANPCRNGGLLLSSRFGYHCLCSKDYKGKFCDGMYTTLKAFLIY